MARSTHPPSTLPNQHLISRFLVDLAMHRDALNEMFKAEPGAHHELLYLQTDQKGVAVAAHLRTLTMVEQALASQYDTPLERAMGWFQQLQAMGFEGEQACFMGCQRLASLGIDGLIGEAHCATIRALPVSWQAKLAALEARLIDDSDNHKGALR